MVDDPKSPVTIAWLARIIETRKRWRISKRGIRRAFVFIAVPDRSYRLYSECISYQACLLRTCTLYKCGAGLCQEKFRVHLSCVSLENAAIRWPVWNSHIHYRGGHCVSNERPQVQTIFPRVLTRGFLRFHGNRKRSYTVTPPVRDYAASRASFSKALQYF